ncbi:unnamed protein product [Onchocerca flexuosa]|uniref:Acyl-CoA_dh_1 domain-containing protein n=1 Tax=Onchocerca flexuosa TaxID=387005 RepID=A0A183I3Y5_9BILA|nr:unnamed protein product [Onchocerca flexuosa]
MALGVRICYLMGAALITQRNKFGTKVRIGISRKGLRTAERAEVLEEMAFSGYVPTFKERHSFVYRSLIAEKIYTLIAADARASGSSVNPQLCHNCHCS